ncbi:histone deacetylase [candidate division KSB1 bacterium]|nr:histone deacetylase [candidate division KSB1 bacterium]
MGITGFIYDPFYLEHLGWRFHPERPDRLNSVVEHMKESSLWDKLLHFSPIPADIKWIETVHTPTYIQTVKNAFQQGRTQLDPDTGICESSYDVALLAAGAGIVGVDAVMNEEVEHVFCAVRPPGHHAERDRAMGFCLFNNIAIAARYAQIHYHLERILILDWDAHHGNGTQHAFEEDSSVFYISLHQWPFYPGTGSSVERGIGAGKGYTMNIPLPPGTGDREYLQCFTDEVIPAIDQFHPELILISAGFDTHADDPLAMLDVSTDGFAQISRLVADAAYRHCLGKIVSVLEGGYNLNALSESVMQHLHVLCESNME